jgi:hypothetical protein
VAWPCPIGYRLPGRFVPATESAPAWRGTRGEARRDGRACALQRRQLLRLAEQAAGAALLGAPSLVVGHALKLSVDAAPQARPRVVRIATFNPAEMQATQVLSNQDSGAIDKIVSELLAALAAHEARSGLSRLAEKLAGLRASDAQPRAITSRRLRARRPGWVLDAVVRAFGDRRADEAHGDSCCNGATARSVDIHRVRQLVPAHGHSRT